MANHRVWEARPAALTLSNDGSALRVANAFTAPTGWQIVGGRLYVPATVGNPVGYGFAVWGPGATLASTPLQMKIINTVAGAVGSFIDVVFDTPVDVVGTNQSYWIGYITDFDYWSSSALPTAAIAAADGSGVSLVSTAAGRGRYSYNNGTVGNATLWWGVDVLVSDTPIVRPPTTSAGAAQSKIEPYSTVTLTATQTPGTNPITSNSWAWVSGGVAPVLSGTGLSRTFVAPLSVSAAGQVFRHTVSDGTLVATSDTTVSAYPASVRVVQGGVEVPATLGLAVP